MISAMNIHKIKDVSIAKRQYKSLVITFTVKI